MAAKGKRGQKLNQGESLYKPAMIQRVRQMILLIQPLKANSELNYSKIAKVMDIPARTFSYWMNPESDYYKTDFAKAILDAGEELRESFDLAKTKRAMINRSQGYLKIKKTKELKTIGPKMPSISGMNKADLIKTAKKLGLKVDKRMTNGGIKLLIIEFIEKQTCEKLVVVKQEEEHMMGDVAAGKLVTANIGAKDKQWKDKQEVEVVGQSIADIAAIMSGRGKRKV